jgi:hypothetical protein
MLLDVDDVDYMLSTKPVSHFNTPGRSSRAGDCLRIIGDEKLGVLCEDIA